MNKSFWVVLLFFSALTLLATNTVKLGWCPSPSFNVSGYRIVYGIGEVTNWAPEVKQHSLTNPCDVGVIVSRGSNWFRTYTNSIDVGNNLTHTVTNLKYGKTYFFSVVAYSSFGDEAPFSNEVMYQVPVKRPPIILGLTVLR